MATSTYDWITVAEWKAWKGTTSTDDDAKIQSMITLVSGTLDAKLDRVITEQDHTEYFSYTDDTIRLSNIPVNSITAVTYGEYDVDYGAEENDGSNYFATDLGYLYAKKNADITSTNGTIKVEYNAGYATANVPAKYKNIACLLCDNLMNRTNAEWMVGTKTVGNVTVKYSQDVWGASEDPVFGLIMGALNELQVPGLG